MSEESVSIISSEWDYSRDSTVQVLFYAELESDRLPGQAIFNTFLQTDCSPHAALFHFSVDSSFTVRLSAALTLIQSQPGACQARNTLQREDGRSMGESGVCFIPTTCFFLILSSAGLE